MASTTWIERITNTVADRGRELLRLRSDTTQDTLADLCRISQDRQGEVADQLGVQVRNGLERLIWAWDEANRATHGELLKGMSEDQIYEMGLVYEVKVDDDSNVYVLMTLTSPMCPVAELLPEDKRVYVVPDGAVTRRSRSLTSVGSTLGVAGTSSQARVTRKAASPGATATITLWVWACVALPIVLVTRGERTARETQRTDADTVTTWVSLRFSAAGFSSSRCWSASLERRRPLPRCRRSRKSRPAGQARAAAPGSSGFSRNRFRQDRRPE